MPRECKWEFEGIRCEYVDEGQDSYYQIIITIMALKERQVLEPLQTYLADLDAACSIGGDTTLRNKLGHITQLRFAIRYERDMDALREKIIQLGLPVISSTSPSIASVSSSSAQSSSSSSFHRAEMHIARAERVDIEQAYAGGHHTHTHEAHIPGLTDEAKRLAQQIREQPDKVYETWGPIPKDNPDFSGREGLLKALIQHFIVRDEGAQQVLPPTVLYQAVTGLGGVGKTQVAARYVHLCLAQQRAAKAQDGSAPAIFNDVFNAIQPEERPSMPGGAYHAIVWLDASDESSLLRSFQSVAEKIGLVFEPKQAGDLESVREAVYTRLGHLPRVLLVWDDVTEATQLHEHLPTDSASTWQGTCDCLLTTRDRLLAERYHGLEVGIFSREESVAYLKHALKLKTKPEKDLKRLAMTLGHLPLALAQAVSYTYYESILGKFSIQ